MNLSELVETVRRVVDEPVSINWTDAEILTYLNRAGERMLLRLIETDLNVGMDNATLSDLGVTLTQIGGSKRWQTSQLPFYVHTIKRIEDATYDAENPEALMPRRLGESYGMHSQAREWEFGGDRTLIFYADTIPAVGSIRVFFYRRFPPLVRFRIQNGNITAATGVVKVQRGLDDSTANGLGSLQKITDIYKGAQFHIHAPLSSLSYARPADYKGIVTAYALLTEDVTNPTYQFTVTPAPAVLPGVTTATASTTPNFDDQFDELLCYEAALRALDKEANSRAKESLALTISDLWNQFIATQNARQMQEPRYVRYLE